MYLPKSKNVYVTQKYRTHLNFLLKGFPLPFVVPLFLILPSSRLERLRGRQE